MLTNAIPSNLKFMKAGQIVGRAGNQSKTGYRLPSTKVLNNFIPFNHHSQHFLNRFLNHSTVKHQFTRQLKCLNVSKGYFIITARSLCSQTSKVFMPPEEFLKAKEGSPDHEAIKR